MGTVNTTENEHFISDELQYLVIHMLIFMENIFSRARTLVAVALL